MIHFLKVYLYEYTYTEIHIDLCVYSCFFCFFVFFCRRVEIRWQTETEEIVFKKEKNINYLELNVKSSDGFLENLDSKKQLIKHLA